MKTTIDYLRFRTQAEPMEVFEAFKPMFGSLGTGLRLKLLERGSMGFQQASSICIEGMPIARLDFGGDSQRGWVRAEMSGKGCEWVQDWDAVQSIAQLAKSQPRRLDIALTTWKGEITHDRVVQAHSTGRFHAGGRPPSLQQITSSDERAGKTCYVGKRTSDKFFRAYEKGFEMASKNRGLPGPLTQIDGHNIEDIYRCEVEFKAGLTEIEWDVIGRRDHYFAGAYPFCSDVLPGIETDTFHRRKERGPQTDLALALENCCIQFGPTLYTALEAYGGDILAVWDKIKGRQHCQALVEAGVLLVDHD